MLMALLLLLGIYEINGIGHGHVHLPDVGRPSPDVKFADCCRQIHQLPAELAHIGRNKIRATLSVAPFSINKTRVQPLGIGTHFMPSFLPHF
jgi:hypothetical protein